MYNSSFYNKKDTFSGNYINVYNFVLHNNQILNILYSSFDSNSKLKILDIGGGTGVRSKPLLNELRKRNDIEYWGIDISRKLETSLIYDRKKIFNLEKEIKLNTQFDIILCFEVVEHILNTDIFMKNLQNLLKKEGILLISTPNITSLKNRIALNLGIVPLSLETSFKNYYGLKFRFIKHKFASVTPSGHIRGFSPLALSEFLKDFKINTLHIYGIENWSILRWLNHFPSLATNFLLVCTKK